MNMGNKSYETFNNNNGFTLIEVMIALAIVSIVLGSMYGLFSNMNKSFTSQNVASNTQETLRSGINYLIRDFRMAGYDPTGDAGAGITIATNTSIQFTADNNGNGDDFDSGEDITYSLSGTNLQLTDSIGTETLIPNVTTLQFLYYDSSGNITADLSEISIIEIALTVQEPAGRANPVERNLTTRVRARNLGI